MEKEYPYQKEWQDLLDREIKYNRSYAVETLLNTALLKIKDLGRKEID